MAAYLIAQIQIDDRERYAQYEAGFMDIFMKYSGKILSVDETVATKEGDWPYTRTVLIEFPSKDEANAWYESDEYQQLAEHRLAASKGNIVLIQGLG